MPYPFHCRNLSDLSDLALKSFISDTETSFNAQMQSKQSLIDLTQNKLRESSTSLAEERRRLSELEQISSERKVLRERIANLRRKNEQQQAHVSRVTRGDARNDVQLGEADAGLKINTDILPPSVIDQQQPITALSPQQREYIAKLPPAAILRARATGYRQNNERLDTQANDLRCQSSELEGTLREIMTMCTGMGEQRIEKMMGGLNKAVEAEKGGDDVELGRVRTFLRKIEGEGVVGALG